MLTELRVVAWDSAHFFADGGAAPIVVTRDGLVASLVPAVAHCGAALRISRIDPALGVMQGGTMVTVYGTGFGEPARCRFGWLETAAENITAHLMRCPVPPLNQTFVESGHPQSVDLLRLVRHPLMLEVSMMSEAVLDGTPLTDAVRELRGDNFTLDRFSFQYHDPTRIAISFLRPQGGPTKGDTHIDVHGAGFRPSDGNSNIKCRFSWFTEEQIPTHAGEPEVFITHAERVVVPASYHNSERMSCYSPNRTANTLATFDVSFNEQEYFGANASYSFYTLHNATEDAPRAPPNVVISSIHPVGGPARGGTVLTLFGSGFAPLDDPSGSIEAPRNRELHTLDDGVHDLHRSVISRAGLFCLFAGIDAVVHGAAHPHAPQVRRGVFLGTVVSANEMTCVTPAFEPLQVGVLAGADANVSVEIILNGNLHARTASGIAFSFYREQRHLLPKLHSVQPFGGPAEGGTWLTIRGALLRKLTGFGTPLCRFGSAAENTTTPATIVPDDAGEGQMVRCVTPPLPGERDRRDVALNVAQNGLDYVRRALRFEYYPIDKLVVHELLPSGGPALGGTVVLVSGRRIGTTRGGLRCSFGGSWVAATSVAENTLRCVSPPRLNLTTNVSSFPYVNEAVGVTVNDDVAAVSPSRQLFTYFEGAHSVLAISSIYPRSGRSEGGNSITLHGSGFRDLGGVRCRFGVAPPVLAEAPPPPPPPRPAPGVDGELRLANANAARSEGRVEVYHDGQWGTVCDDFWDLDDARTVCRQLGFGDALNATLHGAYGPGSGIIWLDNVNCAPGTPRLDMCSHSGWGVHDCDHHEDAGVVCTHVLPEPAGPPPPGAPNMRVDDFALTRSAAGAHLGYEESPYWARMMGYNASEFMSLVCRTPPLDAAIGRYDHRAVVRTVELQLTLNGQLYGEAINFTYYPL